MLFSRFLFISSIILLISLNFVNSNGHQGHHPHGHHHSRHSSSEHRIQREHGHHGGGDGGGAHPSGHHFPGHQPFAGGHCGCSASNVHHVTPQNGIPIFLFPDHAQKAVDVILGAEGAFYWDNDELAHRVFDLLAHKFPQKWFMVGVGNSLSSGLVFRLLKGQRQDLLHGTIKVSPGHSPFAFFDRRQFPRENETELWYFVRAVDPIEAEEGAETNSNKIQKKLTECVRKETKSCIPASLASTCSLDFLALIEQHNTQPAIYASEPMQMKVLNMITQCTAENEGTRFYAVMTTANEEQNE